MFLLEVMTPGFPGKTIFLKSYPVRLIGRSGPRHKAV